MVPKLTEVTVMSVSEWGAETVSCHEFEKERQRERSDLTKRRECNEFNESIHFIQFNWNWWNWMINERSGMRDVCEANRSMQFIQFASIDECMNEERSVTKSIHFLHSPAGMKQWMIEVTACNHFNALI